MSVQDQTSTATHGVVLTDVAASKVKSLLAQEGRDDLRLRIGVQPGGCSGLIYQLYFDERTLDGDALRDFDGVEVVLVGGWDVVAHGAYTSSGLGLRMRARYVVRGPLLRSRSTV